MLIAPDCGCASPTASRKGLRIPVWCCRRPGPGEARLHLPRVHLSILLALFKRNIWLFVSQAYGEGSGADCRRHVQKLNLLQARLSEMPHRYSG